MIDPDALLERLVAVLRDIPDLVTLLNEDPDRLTTYSPEYPTAVDTYSAIEGMRTPEIMVAWTGTQIGNRSNGIEHQFSAYLRPSGKVAPMFTALREGVVTSSGQKFKRHQVHDLCHFPDVQGCFTRSVIVGDAVFEYHEVPIRITERGIDS